MNNPNKTTRVFYTYYSNENKNTPGCLETSGTREEAIRIIKESLGAFGSGCRLRSVRAPFANREEIREEIARTEETLNSARLTALAPRIPSLANLRYDLNERLGALRRELAEF